MKTVLAVLLICGGAFGGTPSFTAPTQGHDAFDVKEGAAGTPVTTVAATDTGKTVTYSIVVQNPKSSSDFFKINASTGAVATAVDIDYEALTDTKYTLTIKATSSNDPTETATSSLTITITDANDNTPEFSPVTFCGSVSSTAQADTTVGTYTATDADSTGVVSYNIPSGDDPQKKFRISTAGDLTTTGQAFNKTAKPIYSLVITASDGVAAPANTGTATVTVVLDGNGTCPSSTANTKKNNKNSASIATATLISGIVLFLYQLILSF